MPRDARKVMASLEKKGFERKEGDHAFFHLLVEGKKTPIFTKVSHGEREISDSLLSGMKKALRLSKSDFDALLDCPMTHKKLVQTLRSHKHIS